MELLHFLSVFYLLSFSLPFSSLLFSLILFSSFLTYFNLYPYPLLSSPLPCLSTLLFCFSSPLLSPASPLLSSPLPLFSSLLLLVFFFFFPLLFSSHLISSLSFPSLSFLFLFSPSTYLVFGVGQVGGGEVEPLMGTFGCVRTAFSSYA